MRWGRRACRAAKAITQAAAQVNATRVSTADQPKTGGRCKRKKISMRPKKRSMLVRLPNSSAVQVGSSPFCCFWRLESPRDDRDRAQRRVDPGDQLEAPIAGIQANETRADM